MKCAIYRRVSTELQSEEGFSLEAQKSRLLSYIESQGWELIEDYADEGASAKNIERPALQRLLNDMRNGKFEVILVYRLDRLVRSVSDLHSLLSEFEKNNVKFKSATEVFDTTSAMGRLFITMVGAMAQWERENLAERVTMGMFKRHEEGQRNGAKAPFGYEIGENGDLIVNEEDAKWVRYIFDAFKTKGRQKLAAELNSHGVKTKSGTYWSDHSITYLIGNPVYLGKLRWNYRKASGEKTGSEVLVDGTHEAIITKEQFDRAQEAKSLRKGAGNISETEYPYTGILTCARCGRTMFGGRRKKKDGYNRYYRCQGRFRQGICDIPVIPESLLDNFIKNELDVSSFQPNNYVEEDINVDELLKELAKIKKAKSLTLQQFQMGDFEDDMQLYRTTIDGYKKKEKELTTKINSSNSKTISSDDLKDDMNDIINSWDYLSLELKKRFITSNLQRITVDVISPSTGGPGSEPVLEFKDYQWRR